MAREEVVRRLFREHGGVLSSAALVDVLNAYEKEVHVPLMPAPLLARLEAFVSANADLEIDCDAFLGLVRSLDAAGSERESVSGSEYDDTLLENSMDLLSASPDTTMQSEPPVTPAKHRGLQGDVYVSPQIMRSAFSEHDLLKNHSQDPGRSAVLRKLAKVNDALERLQMEHDHLAAEKNKLDVAHAHVQKELGAVRRDLCAALAADSLQKARIAELEHLAEVHEKETHAREAAVKRAASDLEDHTAMVRRLESDAQAHGAELAHLQRVCEEYAGEMAALHTTCDAQRDAIGGLEGTITVLEDANAAAERLRKEYDTFRTIHQDLESELALLREARADDAPVLALELGVLALGEGEGCVDAERTDPIEKGPHLLCARDTQVTEPDPKCEPDRMDAGQDSLSKEAASEEPRQHTPLSPALQGRDKHDNPPSAHATRHIFYCKPIISIHRRAVAQRAALVLFGVWLGLWVYYFLIRTASLRPFAALDKSWHDVNMLFDPQVRGEGAMYTLHVT
ncbi:hypothetical protein MVES1_003117 [Malassezia vespertilionis]|uniref:Uncharacterized protein n=1 Tax=Malassezia vespertilionis TaxID=2020962 RepID=A0A2N1J9U9_9BASI|nr:uncharacterized protein MVES1_003117 [Malassezia vespertilionis]PKI83331.1 hypothetical protein MVES_002957 [Malassezia vespertilionis]WFD07747.1 hypothetical protein MVES1_003117 [Malassezia vespertilionis]